MERFTMEEEGKGKDKQFCVFDTINREIVARFGTPKAAQKVIDRANQKYQELYSK